MNNEQNNQFDENQANAAPEQSPYQQQPNTQFTQGQQTPAQQQPFVPQGMPNQPYYNQPYQSYQPYGQPKPSNGTAIASLVLGIISIFSGGFILAIIGLCLGISSNKKLGKNGLSTAGIITSIFGIVLGIIVTIVLVFAFIEGFNDGYSSYSTYSDFYY